MKSSSNNNTNSNNPPVTITLKPVMNKLELNVINDNESEVSYEKKKPSNKQFKFHRDDKEISDEKEDQEADSREDNEDKESSNLNSSNAKTQSNYKTESPVNQRFIEQGQGKNNSNY